MISDSVTSTQKNSFKVHEPTESSESFSKPLPIIIKVDKAFSEAKISSNPLAENLQIKECVDNLFEKFKITDSRKKNHFKKCFKKIIATTYPYKIKITEQEIIILRVKFTAELFFNKLAELYQSKISKENDSLQQRGIKFYFQMHEKFHENNVLALTLNFTLPKELLDTTKPLYFNTIKESFVTEKMMGLFAQRFINRCPDIFDQFLEAFEKFPTDLQSKFFDNMGYHIALGYHIAQKNYNLDYQKDDLLLFKKAMLTNTPPEFPKTFENINIILYFTFRFFLNKELLELSRKHQPNCEELCKEILVKEIDLEIESC